MTRRYLLLVLCLQLLVSSCAVVYKSTGDVMIGYAQEEGVPYMLSSSDVALGCSMAEAFTPFLLSFSRVTTAPDELAILFYLLTGNCIESDAQEQELRYLRAIYTKNSIEAQDARIAQQRLLEIAASRQLTGYYALVAAIAEPGDVCPALDSDEQELYWLFGLLNGIQAIINDIASGGNIEVPLDIAARVGRGASCLDNKKWWGAPEAIQAAIGIAIPGDVAEGINPREKLQHSLEIGTQSGMGVSHVLAAQVYLGQGNISEVKQVIRGYAVLGQQAGENQQYNILHKVAKLQMQAISDRLWTEATGVRTPLGKFGTFWDDTSIAIEMIDIDEIL